MTSMDFSNVAAPSPVPEAEYVGRISKAVVGVSKAGADKIDVHIKIGEGEHEGRVVFDTISFHDNALMFTKRTLLELKVISEDDMTIELEELPELLVGMDVRFIAKVQESDPAVIDERTGEPYEPRNAVARYLEVL